MTLNTDFSDETASWQAFGYVQNIHSHFVLELIIAYCLEPNFHFHAAPELSTYVEKRQY